MDMGTIGCAEWLRFPGFPSRGGKPENAHLCPLPTGINNKDSEIENIVVTQQLGPMPMTSIDLAPGSCGTLA
jgi:hypothetical protein